MARRSALSRSNCGRWTADFTGLRSQATSSRIAPERSLSLVDPARLRLTIRAKNWHLTQQFHISHFATLAVEYVHSNSLCTEEVGA